jgi:hypothetical protein
MARISTIFGAALLTAAANFALAADASVEEWRLATVTPQEALAIDALLTTVNGEPVYAKDVIRPLDEEFKTMAGQMKEQKKSLREFRDLVAARLDVQLRDTIRNILMFSAAKDALNEDELRRIDQLLNADEKKILSRYRGARALADAALRDQGTSLDKEMLNRRRQLTMMFYQHKVLAPQINVRRQDVVDEYENNIAKYTVVPEVDLHLIRIDVSAYLKDIPSPTPAQIKDAESKAWAEAQAIYKRLQAGADFAKEAERNSKDPRRLSGGHYPHEKLTAMKWPELSKKAFAAPSNSLIEPFAAPDPDGNPKEGVMFVLKVGEVIKGRVKPFEDVQEEITARLQQAQEQALEKQLTAKLFNKAAIDFKFDAQQLLDTVTQVVVARYAVQDDR